MERGQGRSSPLRGSGPPHQPEHRQDRGRRLGLLRAVWCNIDCRVSLYPGQSAADAGREITDRIAAFAAADAFLANSPPKVVFNGFHAEGYVLEEGSEAEAVLGRAHETAIGAPLKSFMTGSYLDTRVYALYNQIPALCYGPKSRNIHGIDECVSLQSVRKITQTMALFIAEWCGTEAVDG